MDLGEWEAFVDREMARGVNLAILIGGEPTLCLDRVEAFYKRLPTFCATNGLIKVPRDRFPDMMVGISLWGDEADETRAAGQGYLFHLQQATTPVIPTPITSTPSPPSRSARPNASSARSKRSA